MVIGRPLGPACAILTLFIVNSDHSLAACFAELPSAHAHAESIATPHAAASAPGTPARGQPFMQPQRKWGLLDLPPEMLRLVLQVISYDRAVITLQCHPYTFHNQFEEPPSQSVALHNQKSRKFHRVGASILQKGNLATAQALPGPAALRALAATCRLLRSLAGDVVPGLKLTLYPHQVRALLRPVPGRTPSTMQDFIHNIAAPCSTRLGSVGERERCLPLRTHLGAVQHSCSALHPSELCVRRSGCRRWRCGGWRRGRAPPPPETTPP